MPSQLDLDFTIYLLAGILMLAVIMTYLSHRIGIPGLVLFIGLGMLFGSDVLGLVDFDNPILARLIGGTALILILFEGGLKTDRDVLRRVAVPAGILATLGVIISAAVLGYAAHLVLKLSLLDGMLLGAIVGSTDAAATFAILGPRRIQERVKYTLEAESALNDPMAIFLTILALTAISAPSLSAGSLIGTLIWQAICGLAVSILFGRLAIWLVNKFRLGGGVFYPVFFFSSALIVYSLASALDGSGFLAVYVFGVIIGNASIPYRHNIVRFHEGIAWLAQVIVFTMLGLLVFPSQLGSVATAGLVLSAILILLARPIAVWLCTIGLKFNLREKTFLSWAGLRGAVPVVLATYPFLVGHEHSQLIFNTVFFLVITSTLIQGTTITPVARVLKLELGPQYTPIHTLELTSLGQAHVELVEYHVTDDCYAVSKQLAELDLPDNVTICAISRGESVVAPRGTTEIVQGDFLFVLTPMEKVEEVKRILADGITSEYVVTK